jgi:hypothetical protein
MAGIQGKDKLRRSSFLGRAGLLLGLAGFSAVSLASEPTFDPVYDLLEQRCGECHVRGEADGPWSLDTPPSTDRYPACLTEPEATALRCATWHELVQSPGPGIPAWVRPNEATASEPYVQACNPDRSFHIGHSLPAGLTTAECELLRRWIEAGAQR